MNQPQGERQPSPRGSRRMPPVPRGKPPNSQQSGAGNGSSTRRINPTSKSAKLFRRSASTGNQPEQGSKTPPFPRPQPGTEAITSNVADNMVTAAVEQLKLDPLENDFTFLRYGPSADTSHICEQLENAAKAKNAIRAILQLRNSTNYDRPAFPFFKDRSKKYHDALKLEASHFLRLSFGFGFTSKQYSTHQLSLLFARIGLFQAVLEKFIELKRIKITSGFRKHLESLGYVLPNDRKRTTGTHGDARATRMVLGLHHSSEVEAFQLTIGDLIKDVETEQRKRKEADDKRGKAFKEWVAAGKNRDQLEAQLSQLNTAYEEAQKALEKEEIEHLAALRRQQELERQLEDLQTDKQSDKTIAELTAKMTLQQADHLKAMRKASEEHGDQLRAKQQKLRKLQEDMAKQGKLVDHLKGELLKGNRYQAQVNAACNELTVMIQSLLQQRAFLLGELKELQGDSEEG